MNELIRNILRFVLLVFVQVFLLNNVLIGHLVVPSIYFLFILLLPFTIAGWALLLLGFVLGSSVDMLMNTPGLHAAACVFIAFIRPLIIRILVSRDDIDSIRPTPSFSTMGRGSFLLYVAILSLFYHLIYYLLEVFSFSNLFYLSTKILLATVLSFSLILLYELLFSKQKTKVTR